MDATVSFERRTSDFFGSDKNDYIIRKKIKIVQGFLKFHLCLTVPHYITWNSLAEREKSGISENPGKKEQKRAFDFLKYRSIFY